MSKQKKHCYQSIYCNDQRTSNNIIPFWWEAAKDHDVQVSKEFVSVAESATSHPLQIEKLKLYRYYTFQKNKT